MINSRKLLTAIATVTIFMLTAVATQTRAATALSRTPVDRPVKKGTMELCYLLS